METFKTYRAWWIGLTVLCCLWWLSQQPPHIEAQLLPGTWRMPCDFGALIWTISPDGQFRWEFQQANPWAQWMGLDQAAVGTWQLHAHRLTVEFTTTPGWLALAGQNWTGKPQTWEIRTLSATQLEFRDPEIRFTRMSTRQP